MQSHARQCVLVLSIAVFCVVCVGCDSRPKKAIDGIRTSLRIDSARELSDSNIRAAVLSVLPVGSSIADVFEKMASSGLGPGHCAPGEVDGGPHSGLPNCEFRSDENTCGAEYVNFNIYFVLDQDPKANDLFAPGATRLRDVKVQRWTRECMK